ncbi:galactose oxidase-like domain-containing protein [Micromonospora sp. NPDC049559]|uniref:galactose oxidase-like domain-containing protein n=1 Tax=Micromonospora sp. NPDC049559 TaxID=3155923 RepID=UPI003414DCD1
MKHRDGRRLRKRFLLKALAAAVVIGANTPPIYSFASDYAHDREINSAEYKARYGFWQVVELPPAVRVNAIHAALLDTGKLLIIAGSGNDQAQFDAGTFKTLVYDPNTGRTKLVPTPTDLFCAGHAFLPDGKLLVAGGTLRYEVLKADVKYAGGTMVVKNESPDGAARTFPKGTEFVAPNGKRYRAAAEFTVPPATKTLRKNGPALVTASQTTLWVDAVEPGGQSISTRQTQYTVTGLTGDDARNIYGLSDRMSLDKQDFQGRKETYEFNPRTEQYERVDDMSEKRWYPTLTGLDDGKVLATSGLDGKGEVVDGTQNEIYDPKTKKWTVRPDLARYFPTYPALFQTATADRLFYSGSNAGYGPADKGREPGFWNLGDNTFQPVPGLRDPDLLETSGSGWVGPVQDQKIMVVGGGGVGESNRSTGRIDIIRLTDRNPHFTPGPSLPEGTRYPNLVQLPDDTTLITGGSKGYRGKGDSDNHTARIYHPETNSLSYAADPTVGRDYHSEALLLPDGRVMTMGSDPLFKNKQNTVEGEFEQRLEIYTPAYLYQGARPTIGDGPAAVQRGRTVQYGVSDNGNGIATARLIRPSAVTHATNVEQRSVGLDLRRIGDRIELTIPKEPAVLPPGYYMLFVTDRRGVPSTAKWVLVR